MQFNANELDVLAADITFAAASRELDSIAIAVNISVVVNIGYHKGETVTEEVLRKALVENFAETLSNIDPDEAIDSVEVLDGLPLPLHPATSKSLDGIGAGIHLITLIHGQGYRIAHGNGFIDALTPDGAEDYLRPDPRGPEHELYDADIDGFWFTWAVPGMADSEAGDTFASEAEALTDALKHFMENAVIPVERYAQPSEAATAPLTELDATEFGTYTFTHDGTGIHDPSQSECGRFPVSPETYGFRIVDTGGGCTAWRRDFTLKGAPVYMLVTAGDNADHNLGDVPFIGMGVYSENDEAFVIWTQARESLAAEAPPQNVYAEGTLPG